jgi:DNA-binding MarR family transcriptional regulator
MADLKSELKQTRDFESLEQEAALNIQRTASQISGPYDRLFKDTGLSGGLYNILRILRGQKGGGLACSHIGERMVTRDPDVTRLTDKLLKMGLVSRDRSTTDRRVVLISLTTEGNRVLAKLDQPISELNKRVLGHLSRTELKELNRLLVKARNQES